MGVEPHTGNGVNHSPPCVWTFPICKAATCWPATYSRARLVLCAKVVEVDHRFTMNTI